MTKVLILGAAGQIARHAVEMLGEKPDVQQTLFVREQRKVQPPTNARVVVGDVLNRAVLAAAMEGQDAVYANLSGAVDKQAEAIIAAMQKVGVKRLIFVTTLGIYDEVPGKFGAFNRSAIGTMLPPYRRAADVIEASGLDYTILRPAWLTDTDEVAYETTEKGESFQGTEVSRKSVAALVVKLLESGDGVGHNLGVSKPGTDGDKPSFM